MENLIHIFVFKTNINTAEDKTRVRGILDNNAAVQEWSVDCDDIDCVLRVVSHKLSASEITKLINEAGYQCEELH